MGFDDVTPEDFSRLEGKVDKMADAVQKLILVEERQSNQKIELDKHEKEIHVLKESVSQLHSRVDKYTYFATGVTGVIVAMFEVARFVFKA